MVDQAATKLKLGDCLVDQTAARLKSFSCLVNKQVTVTCHLSPAYFLNPVIYDCVYVEASIG